LAIGNPGEAIEAGKSSRSWYASLFGATGLQIQIPHLRPKFVGRGVIGVPPDRSKPLPASATSLATETEAAAECTAKFAGIS
jgi:hypothetical protein